MEYILMTTDEIEIVFGCEFDLGFIGEIWFVIIDFSVYDYSKDVLEIDDIMFKEF